MLIGAPAPLAFRETLAAVFPNELPAAWTRLLLLMVIPVPALSATELMREAEEIPPAAIVLLLTVMPVPAFSVMLVSLFGVNMLLEMTSIFPPVALSDTLARFDCRLLEVTMMSLPANRLRLPIDVTLAFMAIVPVPEITAGDPTLPFHPAYIDVVLAKPVAVIGAFTVMLLCASSVRSPPIEGV